MRRFIPYLLGAVVLCTHAWADPLTARLEHLKPELVKQFSVPIEHWRFHQPDIPGAERPDFNDSAWRTVAPGFSWSGTNTKVWFRANVTLPSELNGHSVEGLPVRLDVGMDDDGELYVDGQLKEAFHWDDGHYTLTERGRPGQTFSLAVRGINGPGNGQFHFARLYFDVLPQLGQYIEEAEFVSLLVNRAPASEQTALKRELSASEACVTFDQVSSENLEAARAQLAKARAALAPVAAYAKKFDVFYIGHAHIDMNWQWPWTETIDVCHRTWNSAMNLMGEFPQFHFVQSQPAAYVPIEEEYPKEFARMQLMASRGQWDTVGGLWNESDTDIPSGEALARSLLLGQRYFKSKFGHYALTGWLPDSFGHTWQLPQIMRLTGIRYFYHMRCGNGMMFTWWESPDGSRVLKANTRSYDANVRIEQMLDPMANETRFQLPQSLAVFGVGDHGGGPTREQILHALAFQQDPLLPRVHFVSADTFFEQLERQPAAAALPVVDTGLQYIFEGCYTTHADIKKAIRGSENNLYSAEVLSSLAAMMGRPYPTKAFRDAWKPTAFAQFHDIACGSAIHSTYDWMHEQLAPAFRFEKEQTDKRLDALTDSADTRGPGSQAIVVWNTLSFPRDDVVRAPLADAQQYHSVVDRQGRSFPAQVMDGSTLVFIARDVPAFGHAVYFPSTTTCSSDGIELNESSEAYDVQTPRLSFQINRATGAITRLNLKSAKWSVFGDAHDADEFQLLGDSGSAWTIRYTGESRMLTTEGAKVTVLDRGPVFVRVRVSHAFGRSTYMQDVIAYGALPRIDIPTTVDWQEEHQLLKICLPVNATRLEARAQIPFGSIARPTNGQECPGQKWMDVSQANPVAVENAAPLRLARLFNNRSTDNFDGDGNEYAAELRPSRGVHRLGDCQVPFELSETNSNGADNVVPSGQQIPLPAGVSGDTLYLLGACANGGRWTDIGFRLKDGSVESRAFALNDWVVDAYPDNSVGLTFAYRRNGTGRDSGSPPKLWIVSIPLPKGATALRLPHDPQVHLFAATIATRRPAEVPYGLSVLNDSKYGFDVVSNVFRLTALRSSSNPDPRPDQGMQTFTYSLYPHAGSWAAAHTEERALALNIPLLARVALPHAPAGRIPTVSVINVGGQGDLIVSALKHSEDGNGYVLRFYEAQGHDTQARIDFNEPVRVQETDILERPLAKHHLTIQGNSVILPVGHNQIITLRLQVEPSTVSERRRTEAHR